MKLTGKFKSWQLWILVSTAVASWCALAATPGKLAFETNCQACHSLDKFSTGPSLVYIRDQYPSEKSDDFLAWVQAPGKKNPDTIQMPPMKHLGETTIGQIHDYILFISQHIVEKQDKPKFAPYKPPAKNYPYVSRRYLPFTNPASIVVSLTPKLSLAWDTNLAKLRYAFPTFAQFNGEKKRQFNRQQILYAETSNFAFNFAQGQPIQFNGYKLINGAPEFSYQVSNIQVKEKITQGTQPKSFIRHYQVSPIKNHTINVQTISLNLAHSQQNEQSAQIKASHGRLVEQTLHLTLQQAEKFSVEVVLP